MKVDVLPIGLYEENSYVLHDHDHVLFIDPGRNAKQIAACVSEKETADGIILTHGHADHTQAADDISEMYHCPVYMNREDYILVDPSFAGKHGFDGPVYSEILDLQAVMKIGVFDLQIHYTPGHTAGSVCIQYKNLLFSGDTLFAGSIGRTDHPGGDYDQLIDSIDRKLMPLDGDITILPGHGTPSSIGYERATNPFLQPA